MAPAEQITGKKIAAADEAMRECTAVEVELAELRAQYDQYFLGVERKPPTKRHEAVRKQIQTLKNSFIRQTSVRFRIENLSQKMTTFERLWDRTLKEIEAGTYKRHLFKAKMHAKAEHAPAPPSTKKAVENFDIDEDLDLSDLDPQPPASGDLASALSAAASASKPEPKAQTELKTAPAVPPVKATTLPARPSAREPEVLTSPNTTAPTLPTSAKKVVSGPQVAAPVARQAAAVAAPPRPVATSASSLGEGAAGGLSEQKIKAIYDAYVMAKKRCGEDTSKLSLNSVADTLKKQVPELMKQHKAKSVEFKVVIKDGKAVLRALPKE